jgi:SNF2 family DNA or RNA helicase
MEIALRDFLADYGQSLKQKVIESFKPIYTPSDKDRWDNEAELKLDQLKRKLFPAQTSAVLSLAKGFYQAKKRGLILVGEMGAGKSAMAIAVAHLMPKRNYRVMIMCPPHLVRKWMREIEVVLPKCRVINLNGKGLTDLEALRYAEKPTCPEFYVIGRERAKGHYSLKTSVVRQKHLSRILCPKCGKELDEILKSKRPRCPGCDEALYSADKDGFRRFAKVEYIKKYLHGKIDLFVADEIHECKSGVTAQGQAFADIACVSKRTLALTGTLLGGYSTNLFYLLWRLMPGESKRKKLDFRSPMGFAEMYGIVQRTQIETRDNEYTAASIGRSRGTRTIINEKPGVSPLVLTDFLLEHTVFLRLPDVSNSLPPFNERIVEVAMSPDQAAAYKDFERELTSEVKRALALQDHPKRPLLIRSP